MPEPAKLFTFPPRGRGEDKPVIVPTTPPAEAEAPAAPAPEPVVVEKAAAAPEPVEEGLKLTPPEPVAEAKPQLFVDEELLLDSTAILTPPVSGNPLPPADEAPGNRRWVAEPEPEQRAPRIREGGTLFERMSNIARGAAKAQVEEEREPSRTRDPLDIPRFLNKQNNQ
jgi:cell division protein FtsZ